jgi:hypothetical protein
MYQEITELEYVCVFDMATAPVKRLRLRKKARLEIIIGIITQPFVTVS